MGPESVYFFIFGTIFDLLRPVPVPVDSCPHEIGIFETELASGAHSREIRFDNVITALAQDWFENVLHF